MTSVSSRSLPEAAMRHRNLSQQLQRMPNVGPAAAEDLLRLGITTPDDLIGRDPQVLYDTLCEIDGVRHDPCMLDVFTAVVAYAEGGPPTPWYDFTPARKNRPPAPLPAGQAAETGTAKGRASGERR